MHCFTALVVVLLAVTLGPAKRIRTKRNLNAYLTSHLPGNRFLAGTRGTKLKRAVIPLMQKIIAQGGCNPNVCFALDGSGSVSSDNYQAQKEFIELAAVLIGIDKSAHFAAVQYTRTLTEISPLTSDQDSFFLGVQSSTKLGGATFVPAGLAYCVRELRPFKNEDANKIVLMGDGRNNFGSGRLTGPLRRFIPPLGRGQVSAVGVGDVDGPKLLEIAGAEERVQLVDDYFSLADIVEELVGNICEL